VAQSSAQLGQCCCCRADTKLRAQHDPMLGYDS
jgi:hypothetical protein